MNQSGDILGKVPPQAIGCEETVLGTILVYPQSMNNIIAILREDMFYKTSHGVIFRNALEVFKKDNAVDLITLIEKLRDNGELDQSGGALYLSELTNKIIGESQLENHALIVREKYLLREYIRIGNELTIRAFTDDLADISEYSENELLKLSDQTHRKEPTFLGKIIDRVIDKIQKIINHEIKLIGIPSGFTMMDRLTGGFKEGELTIIAGRPSMGKSALALQISKNAAELNYPVGLFSCEMSEDSLAQRYISGVSGKTNIELLNGDCSIDHLLTSSEGLIKLPIYIDDTSSLTVLELRSKARKLILKHGIKMIIVDYLQLMIGDSEHREQEISRISRGLKSIAKDLNIPVIALSQLSRKVEERADRRPLLSDLRESGAIEQDADMVIFVLRPAYYDFMNVIVDGQDRSSIGMMELIFAKNRNGATGSFYVQHNTSLTEITDIEKLTF